MQLLWWRLQRRRNHSIFGRNTRILSEAVESSPSPCKLDHGGLEPNAVAIYEEVMYRMLPLIHSSHLWRTKISNHVWVKRSIPCTRKNRTIECLNITIDMSLNGKTTKTKPTKKDLWLIDVGSFESRLFLTLELEIPNDKLSLDAVQEQSRFIHVAKRHQKTWWVCNKIEENCV